MVGAPLITILSCVWACYGKASFEFIAMNVEKLMKMAGAVRTGGKGSMRRKKKAVHKTTTTDDKRLQSTLKRIGINVIPAIEEVNIFKDDLVIQFVNPKVQASIAANTWVVSGSPQTKNVVSDLGDDISILAFRTRNSPPPLPHTTFGLRRGGCGRRYYFGMTTGEAATASPRQSFASSDHLRHVESMAQLPSGAGKISHLNAVILGETLASEENDLVFPSRDFSRQALVSSPEQYRKMYERSIQDPAGFWSEIASQFYWKEKWDPEVYNENIDVRKGTVKFEWFKGASTNISYNALDRNIEAGNGGKVAIYWEGNEPGDDEQLTYAELLEKVCQLANYLKHVGVRKGDAVVIYLPMLMELLISMLACARIGAVHSDVVPQFPTKCAVEWVDAEDPLFLLYTSGSTGKPKGVLHTTGGYMVYTATTFKYAFDHKPSDIYWCTADCGWITGHSYVTYGPLLNGATVVVFEGAPNYPNSGRCWDIVDKYKVTLFYTAPTLVRSLMREGDEYVTRYHRKSLRVLGSVGEPINPSAWRWFYNVVGDSRCPISDTWWQTETGGFMITPLPGAWPQKPGSATFPFFGVQPVIVDEKGNEIEGECSGYLCIKKSWPGAFRTLYGDHERYQTTYFKPFAGYYFTGDGCSSGHRIGTAEVESALVSHPHCAEAAVVGVEHEIKGQSIYAFVSLVEGVSYSEGIRKSLILAVRNQIGAFAAPDKIHWAPGLPKTRSGKIMRRILRKIASGQLDELGDTSTLADPSVVDQLIALGDC
ncbi:hypothetical protein C4D60_Mb06t16740 [Musa balbisiana]|uniref:Nascent polypeptide-associated complex subunit beta n=1 Tax=Musa balbisiana TaxID=52838 RepID=A0A4S8INQ8_MUSBA|nr:hypothetical protein C4D60_Mb06t16740 [Musa balbisiana]